MDAELLGDLEGRQLGIIWGGSQVSYGPGGTLVSEIQIDSGGAYDPSTDLWEPLPTGGAPSPRFQHSACGPGWR